jgi:hypothetical protein
MVYPIIEKIPISRVITNALSSGLINNRAKITKDNIPDITVKISVLK